MWIGFALNAFVGTENEHIQYSCFMYLSVLFWFENENDDALCSAILWEEADVYQMMPRIV